MGPDEQPRGDHRAAPRPRPPDRLRRRGVVRGRARAARLRGGADADGARAGAAGGGRGGLGRVHPHLRAGVPQADDRAARDRHRADLGRARGRRPLRPRADARDLGRGPARRGGDRLRDRLPGDPARGRPVGADRLRQPAGDAGRRHPAGVLGLRGGRPLGLGRVPGRVRAADRPGAGGALRVQRGGRRRPAARRRVPVRVAAPQRLRLPRGGRLRAGRAARAGLAPGRLQRAGVRPGVRRRGGAAGRRAADLPLARQPRVHGHAADAAVHRRARARRGTA